MGLVRDLSSIVSNEGFHVLLLFSVQLAMVLATAVDKEEKESMQSAVILK
jgi:hypothetical protein